MEADIPEYIIKKFNCAVPSGWTAYCICPKTNQLYFPTAECTIGLAISLIQAHQLYCNLVIVNVSSGLYYAANKRLMIALKQISVHENCITKNTWHHWRKYDKSLVLMFYFKFLLLHLFSTCCVCTSTAMKNTIIPIISISRWQKLALLCAILYR